MVYGGTREPPEAVRQGQGDKVKNMRSSPSAGGRTRLTIHPTESDTATIHYSPHNRAGERDGVCVGGDLIFIRRRC